MNIDEIVNHQVPSRHTYFQLKFFVIGKEPTHQSKMRRCVEELRARRQTVAAANLEIDELHDRNSLLRWETANGVFRDSEEKRIRSRMIDRKIAANDRAVVELHDRIRNTEEEIKFFVDAFNEMNDEEPMKSWDDTDVQIEYWNAKLLEDVKHRLMTKSPIDVEITKTIAALPGGEVKKLIFKECDGGQGIES